MPEVINSWNEWMQYIPKMAGIIAAVYLVVINLTGFFMMRNDKKKAIRNQWRTPERSFFVISLLLGSLGTWIGMYTFHHKTKHKKFVIGIPLIFFLQVAIIIMFCLQKNGYLHLDQLFALHK